MQLSRQEIERWFKNSGANIKGGTGGSAGGGNVDLSSYAQKAWVEESYVAKSFFNELFTLHGTKTTTVGTQEPLVEEYIFAPNELPATTTTEEGGVTTTVVTAITSIEANVGLWTEKYLSALGQNSSGGGGGGGGSDTLYGLLDVKPNSDETPTRVYGLTGTAADNGKVLTYSTAFSKWIAQTVNPGTDMETVWSNLAANTNEQINASHLTTALSGYLPLAGGTMTGIITRNGGGWWSRARQHAIINTTASNTDTYYAAFSLKTKDGDWSIGVLADTNSLYAVYTTDSVYEAGTNDPIRIKFPTTEGTLALAGDYYTKAQADAKFMTIAAFENLFNALNSSNQKVSHPYSSAVTSIKSLFGLWTEQYLSALGQNSSGGGGGGSDALYGLLDVKPNSDSTPTRVYGLAGTSADNGKVLTYSTAYSKWIAQAVSPSIDMTTVWSNLAANTNEQINASHLTTALSGYLPLTAGSSKALTDSLFFSSRGRGVYLPYTVNSTSVNIPLIFDNGDNLWIGATQTAATHHIGRTFISAGHNGTSGNDTIYVCVPNAANTGGTNYGVWHAGNLDPVGYKDVGSSDLTADSGSFFFGGGNTLKSGYDYVGIQVGNSLDKWQLVAIDDLQWRQNDNGGSSTAYGSWKTLVDNTNLWKHGVTRLSQIKGLTSAGWYRVADVSTYGLSFILTLYGGYYHNQPTPVSFLVSHTYTHDSVSQIGSCAYPGWIEQVRLVRYDSGKIYVDIYYSGTNENNVGVQITPLDDKATNPSNIALVDFTSISSLPSGQTEADRAYVSRSGVKGIYTMNGGAQNPDYFGMKNAGFLMSNQTVNGDGTYKNWLYMDCYWGNDAGGTTAIGVSRSNGRMFVMRSDANRASWNTQREVAVYDTNGYLGVGYGNTTPQYQLDVNGAARVSELWIGSIHITYDSTNGGLLIANGGLSASTYISALGVNSGGGGGSTLLEPLNSINQAGLAAHPTSSGKTIVWNGSAWVYGTAGGASTLNDLTDVSIISPSSNQVLMYNASTGKWVNGTIGGSGGTLSSIGLSMPTGFSVSPSILTSNGTFTVSFASGYSLPTTAKQNQWDNAYTFTSLTGFGTAGTDYIPITLGSTTKNVLTSHQSLVGYATQTWVNNTALAGYATQSWVNTQGFLKTVSGSFWGQSWTNGGTVSGNMTDVGSITMTGDVNMANNTSIRMKPNGGDGNYWNVLTMNTGNTLSLGYYTRTHGQTTDIQGGTITFAVNGGAGTASTAVENRVEAMNIDGNGRVWIRQATQGLRIGDALLTWDATNKVLNLTNVTTGQTASFVASGGVTALG